MHADMPPAHLAVSAFRDIHGGDPEFLARAPGRVNVIGEHVDYNDGYVLPAALTLHVCIACRPRTDRRVCLHATAYDQTEEFSLDDLEAVRTRTWIRYVAGMAWALAQDGHVLAGFDGVMVGNVPVASGLSSSAAVEVAAAQCFRTVSGLGIDDRDLALAAQRAENGFVGVNCGIMDQFISTMGRAGHLLLLDCRSLDCRHVSMPPSVSLVIGNTNASRLLADSAYNQRRAECEEALACLQSRFAGISSWRDVDEEQVEACHMYMRGAVFSRARHVVSEIRRTQQAADFLAASDAAQAGQTMNESHSSLRDDYAVSSGPLDAMVEIMQAAPACLGARLTGAGFGGCAVALTEAGAEEAMRAAILHQYPPRTGLEPQVYAPRVADGADIMPFSTWQAWQ